MGKGEGAKFEQGTLGTKIIESREELAKAINNLTSEAEAILGFPVENMDPGEREKLSKIINQLSELLNKRSV